MVSHDSGLYCFLSSKAATEVADHLVVNTGESLEFSELSLFRVEMYERFVGI